MTSARVGDAMVRSKTVRPPRGQGRIRLVLIGEDGAVDSRSCGGTLANTAEVRRVHISKIENRGRKNRQFRIRFGALEE